MKLTNEDKLAASIAMLRGDSFTRGNATMFPFGCTSEYCVIQMIGAADKLRDEGRRIETTSWTEALNKFEEFMGVIVA